MYIGFFFLSSKHHKCLKRGLVPKQVNERPPISLSEVDQVECKNTSAIFDRKSSSAALRHFLYSVSYTTCLSEFPAMLVLCDMLVHYFESLLNHGIAIWFQGPPQYSNPSVLSQFCNDNAMLCENLQFVSHFHQCKLASLMSPFVIVAVDSHLSQVLCTSYPAYLNMNFRAFASVVMSLEINVKYLRTRGREVGGMAHLSYVGLYVVGSFLIWKLSCPHREAMLQRNAYMVGPFVSWSTSSPLSSACISGGQH